MKNVPYDMINSIKTPANDQSDEIDLRQLFSVMWRGKFIVMLLGLFALVLGSYYAFAVAVPKYTTSSSLALETRQEQVVDIESVVSGIPGDQVAINTEIEVMRSRRLIGKLVTELDLTQQPEFNVHLQERSSLSIGGIAAFVTENVLGRPGVVRTPSEQEVMDSVVNAVLSSISVANVRQSYVFRITAVSEDAELSAKIANALAEFYIEDQIAVKFEKTAQATEWLTDRVADLQIELETSENQLKEFSSNTDLISAEGLIAQNRQLKDLRDRRVDIMATVDATTQTVERLNAAGETGDPIQMAAVADDPTISRLLASGAETSSQETFQVRYDAVMTRARLEQTRAQAQLVAVETSINEISASIDIQSTELVALQQFQREAEASRLIYEYFLSRLKETSVQQGLQQAESRILSYAVVPRSPSAPRKPVILALSLILGLMVGAALVLLREFSQNTFRVAEDLEAKTGYAVIGQVPIIPSRNRKKVLNYLHEKPNSAAAEAIRNLRTSLLLANLDKAPQIIMSTSSIPGEGKTTQSIALAQNLAGLGKKVLLIEGDIRRRVMHEYFDVSKKSGFLSVLLGEVKLEDALTHLPDMGVDILFGERSSTNAADIFSSDSFAKFLDMLRADYDYIIIDTPPVLAVTDARIIARWVDAVIYTVKWDSTTHRQVVDGVKAFEQVNVKISGLVLGQISARGMKRYGYGDSYGAYQAYYTS